jgi:dipeptidyl aminopeptidase/acylaminoacyl peptidase
MRIKPFVLWLSCIIFYQIPLSGQKAKITIPDIEAWMAPGIKDISDDGNHILYTFGSSKLGSTLVVQEAFGNWKTEVRGVSNASFAGNGRFVVCPKQNDTLCIVTVGTQQVEYIAKVDRFITSGGEGAQWLAYIDAKRNELSVRNLMLGVTWKYPNVHYFNFSDNGKVLIIETAETKSDSPKFQLLALRLIDRKIYTIWEGPSKVENVSSNPIYSSISFIAEQAGIRKGSFILYHYEFSERKLTALVRDTIAGNEFMLSNNPAMPQFSKDGMTLFFSVKPKLNVENLSGEPDGQALVWDYRDTKLKSQQIKEQPKDSYVAAISLGNKKVTVIEGQHENILGDIKDVHHNQVLVRTTTGDDLEYGWNSNAKVKLFLVDTNSGKRTLIRKNLMPVDLMNIRVSPDAKFVVYYEMGERNYFSYNISKGTTINISSKIPFPLYDEEHDAPAPPRAISVPVWIQKDAGVLIHDYYDVWLVDPTANVAPVCITESYGRTQRVLLRFMETLQSKASGIRQNEDILLAALDKETKFTGFFSKMIDKKGAPVKHTLGPYIYHYPKPSFTILTFPPLKAKNANVYLLERMSPDDGPNLFVTKDLEQFSRVSNIQPHAQFNWMKPEIIRWTAFQDSGYEGILYKPENFDPKKKYPVIFSVYEKCADELYVYKAPQLSDGGLDIASYVSDGYLVFTPSVRYTIGEPGLSACKTIQSAARHLSQFSWFDSTKLGLQGVSFGAYQVNYVITQCKFFAAAASSAGPSDFVSGYGSIRGDGGSYQFIYETYQSRMGSTLWEQPEAYIKNSPIFYIDNITTPLLLMHNANDGQVPMQQGFELFTAMRRLQKRVWMLQYEGEGHGVRKSKFRKDYTIKLSEYFGHFLKGEAAPAWMRITGK